MAGGLYSVYKVYSNGEILTAADLNATDLNHVTNHIPTMMDDHSADVATYRLNVTPAEGSLPISAAKEFEHLRGGLQSLDGGQYWYNRFWATVGTYGVYTTLAAAIAAGKTKVRLTSDLSVTAETDWTLSNGIIDGQGHSIKVTDSNPITGSILQISGDENIIMNLTLENNDTTGTTTNGLEVDGDYNRVIDSNVYMNGAGGTLTNAVNDGGNYNVIEVRTEDKAGTITNVEA